MLVRAKLLAMKDGATLFEDTFSYGYAVANASTIHLGADTRYNFSNIDALVADPAVTRQGLLDGVTAIAGQIAADIKRN